MGLSLLTNTASLEAQRNLTSTGKALASNFAKLSSGQRINTASDDAAGLAISERMKSQISSMSQAERMPTTASACCRLPTARSTRTRAS